MDKKIIVYLRNIYNLHEVEEFYGEKYNLTTEECQELYDAMYEVEMIYNLTTHKFENKEE